METDSPQEPQPAIIVIFGITGDLSQRKLLPALLDLVNASQLHDHTVVVGVTRRAVHKDEILGQLKDKPGADELSRRLKIVQMDIVNGAEYDKLLNELQAIEDHHGMCMNRLYYLSIPPQVTQPIVEFLGQHGLNQSCAHGRASTRLLIEKPFGYDLESAKELIASTRHYFKEDQIFRIDHYVAKETVQNILAFRFNNPIFTSLWDKEQISGITITAYEQLDIEGRTIFYEQTGALRDFIQNHLLQLLALTTMERPASMSSHDIHAAKLKLLEQVQGPAPNQVASQTVRGQYSSYRNEVGNPDSNVETYAALNVTINNPRWQGVPVLIRTGKALSAKVTEIRLTFTEKQEPNQQNVLVFRIQPNEGIHLSLRVKRPGLDNQLKDAEMDFSYQAASGNAYERVLVDAVRGDHTLFATSQEVLAAWDIVQPTIAEWSKNGDGLKFYPPGSENVL